MAATPVRRRRHVGQVAIEIRTHRAGNVRQRVILITLARIAATRLVEVEARVHEQDVMRRQVGGGSRVDEGARDQHGCPIRLSRLSRMAAVTPQMR